jgi:hypothetical protein
MRYAFGGSRRPGCDRHTRSCARGPRGLPPSALVAAALLAMPGPAAAQIGIYDALARRFSDVSFYANVGGLSPSSREVRADQLTGFGIEVLLTIGGVSRPTGPPVRTDSVVLTWTEMQVVTNATGVDTIHTYQVRPGVVRQPSEPVWSFELGLGYGQMTGFGSNVEGLDLKGAVRDLPTVSLYASYVPSGTYFGVRSGFMKLQALQLYDEEGRSWSGESESFMAGLALGQVLDLLNLSFFGEVGYAMRPFPSIRWSGGPLPTGIPREISLHSWSVGVGVQFALGGG